MPSHCSKALSLQGAFEGTIVLVTAWSTWLSSSLQGNTIICMDILIQNCLPPPNRPEEGKVAGAALFDAPLFVQRIHTEVESM